MSTAEDIVRALAASHAPVGGESPDHYCLICKRSLESGGARDVLTEHAPACAWRLAREWVEMMAAIGC